MNLANLWWNLLDIAYRYEYKVEIEEQFDWDQIHDLALDNADIDIDEPTRMIGRVFLGTVFDLTPSGKYYTFWTSNATNKERENDTLWYEALEIVCADHGGWYEHGDDPCDLYFGMEVV